MLTTVASEASHPARDLALEAIAAGLAEALLSAGALATSVRVGHEHPDPPAAPITRVRPEWGLSAHEAERLLMPALADAPAAANSVVETRAGTFRMSAFALGGDGQLGAVAALLPTDPAEHPVDEPRVSLAVSQAALALAESRLGMAQSRTLATLGRKAMQLKLLADTALAFRSQLAVGEILDTAAGAASQIIQANLVMAAVFEERASTPGLAIRVSDKYAAWRDSAHERSRHPSCPAVQSLRAPVRTPELFLPEGLPEEHPALQGYLAAPLLRRDGRLIGVIQLADKHIGHFSADDEAVITQLAAMTAAAIEQADVITRLRTAADYLAGANAAKDELIGLIAHEVRSPLTVIKGLARLLLRDGERRDPERHDDSLQEIALQVDRLDRTLGNMLALSEAEIVGGVERQPLLVYEVVENAVNEHLRAYPEPYVRLSGERDVIAFTHAGYVEQVLLNLLSNGAKYAREGGRLDVEVRRTGSTATISVSDRGPGIPAELAARMFDPFVRDVNAPAAGLGLGLTVCARLAGGLGGRISYTAREGGGSTFALSVPLLPAGGLSAFG